MVQVTPRDGATNVDINPLIQVHTSEKFNPKSVGPTAITLLDKHNSPVAVRLTSDLGGVITVSVERPLKPGQSYQLRVESEIHSVGGQAIRPFSARFHTNSKPAQQPTAPKYFQFKKSQIDLRDGVCGLALADRRTLFSCTWRGQLVRYRLDEQGFLSGTPEAVLAQPQRRFLSLLSDPATNDERSVLWLTHDSLAGKSLGENDYSGTISRITIRGEDVRVEDFVVGLPTGDHPATGLTFGPDGKLFVSQGALTMLGGRPRLAETPLSAATLEIDLADAAFQQDKRPLNVRTDEKAGFDPATGPLRTYATGIRQSYDLCWHSNGQLYAGVNMNDTSEKTPAGGGVPSISARPAEMIIRIVRGKYYGHPNPSRNEWVLLGGNPTKEIDPWEVPEYPVGTRPDPNFDPSLLIRNLEDDHGPSANGCVEWTGTGLLRGRLLMCFYTATRGIHTYQFSDDGTAVVDHQPIRDGLNEMLRFGAPLDVVFHPGGHLFVADFSAPERGDSGKNGGVWRCAPLLSSDVSP